MAPRWTVEPSDGSAAAGQDVILHCGASGHPEPTITWRKAVGMFPLYMASLSLSLSLSVSPWRRAFIWNSLDFCFQVAAFVLSGDTPGEFKEFLFEPNVSLFPNGSLLFTRINKESESHYLCEARNNIGSGVSKLIFLKVNGELTLHYRHTLLN